MFDNGIQNQIRQIRDFDIPDLIDHLPYGSWYRESFKREDEGLWRFVFECYFAGGRFFASALAESPLEAFHQCQSVLKAQMHKWHETRFGQLPKAPSVPRVLIVDDDVETAMVTQSALAQLGWQCEVATGHEDLHRKIIASNPDIIFLDWQLNDSVTADKIVEKATRLIDTFSDLRTQFVEHRTRIVTFSVLDRDEVQLPMAGLEYFDHLDHWQKPMRYPEILEKASRLV